jgi:hypothetical protein
MNDQQLNALLNYRQPLDDRAFRDQVMQRMATAQRQRRRIMWLFSLLGVLLTLAYAWVAFPAVAWPQLLTPVNGIMLFVTGGFVLWLWTETLTSD